MTETCGMNSYLCPASLNYGCCENGMACGLSNCYSTEVVTLTLTSTLTTTDSNSAQHTITTTMLTGLTPASPTVGATAGAGIISVVPKLYTTAASAIAKISATSTSTPSSGLSKSQIGGIIGGACILLFVILFATFLIMRRLNKAIALSKSQSSSSRSRRRPTRPLQNPEVDALSIDPFNMERELINSNVYMEPRTSRPVPLAALYNTTQDGIEAISPPAFSPNSPPFHTSRGYNAVPISESSCCSGSQSCSSCSGSHALSDTSSPPMNSRGNNPGGYFDQYSPPPRSHSHHGRDWSDGSSRSEASNHTIKELDAGRDGHWYRGPDRRSGIRKALEEFGMSKWGGGRRINRGDKETVGLIGQEAPIGTSAREGQTPRGEMDAVGLGIPAFISEMGSGSRPGTAGWAEKKKSKGEPAVARNERISALQTPDMGFSAEMVEVRTQERRGLSNKQLRDISRASRQGLPDYDAIRPKSKALSDDPEKD
ncbi:hypothetical protein B7494_g8537 [Chlorociboria aeruginascens]|nr:hypothetical protein B7494_g8537 [Chlorociboria aeruginascens]